MLLKQRFYQLPLKFDVEVLQKEVSALPESAWRPHPSGYEGNTALILVAAYGRENDDTQGPMKPTPHLAKCPYISQVLSSFQTVVGRTRLMRLEKESDVLPHTDIAYYWRNRVRVHVPIVTDPSVAFHCEDEQVHMAAGEAWTFDNWRTHKVENPSQATRIHLVMDTVGTSAFWRTVLGEKNGEPAFETFDDSARGKRLITEGYESDPVMPPAEMRSNFATLIRDLRANEANEDHLVDWLENGLDDIFYDWRSLYVVYGPEPRAFADFGKLVKKAGDLAASIPDGLRIASNGSTAKSVLMADMKAALDVRHGKLLAEARAQKALAGAGGQNATGRGGRGGGSGAGQKSRQGNEGQQTAYSVEFDRPVVIAAAPRSGSTMLFETLARNRDLWTIGDESHKHIEGIPALQPKNREFDSNRLTAEDAAGKVDRTLRRAFAADLRNFEGLPLDSFARQGAVAKIRFLEKTPKNALRIPFMATVFPNARFLFLYRDPRENISSLLDSWRSGRFVTYRDLPGWTGDEWSHLLIPGWRDLIGKPLPEIVARQWIVANEAILDDLEKRPRASWMLVKYGDLLANPLEELRRICYFCEIPFGTAMEEAGEQPLAYSKYTLTPPDPDKWKKNEEEIESIIDSTKDVAARVGQL